MRKSMSIPAAIQHAKGGLEKVQERFWSKVDVRGPTECWEFQGSIGKLGYGAFRICGPQPNITRLAHRVSWVLSNGAIPDGLVLNHICRNRSCVNPDHLEVVTRRENTLHKDSEAAARYNYSKTHCSKGHTFSEENTRVVLKPNGTFRQRVCRTCERERWKRINEKRREATKKRREERGWKPYSH